MAAVPFRIFCRYYDGRTGSAAFFGTHQDAARLVARVRRHPRCAVARIEHPTPRPTTIRRQVFVPYHETARMEVAA